MLRELTDEPMSRKSHLELFRVVMGGDGVKSFQGEEKH